VGTHVAASDPHPQYLTPAEGNAAYDALGAAASAVSTHVAASDPHPQYNTQAEGDARYERNLTAGANITIDRTNPAAPVISASGGGGGGEVNTASNLGTGSGLFADKVGVDLQFKSLKAGAGVTLSSTATEVTIVASGAGGAVDSVNGQTGVVVLDTDDIAEGVSNLYFTNGRAAAAAPVQTVDGQAGAVSLSSSYAPLSHVGAGGAAHSNAVAAGAAGFMTGADKTKLDGIATGATQNSSDAFLLTRGNHTGTQLASTISDFNSATRAQVEAELVAGANVTITPSGTGATRQLTISAAGGGGSTNLSTTTSTTTLTVNSDTGTDAVLPAATPSVAGVLTAADKTKLDGIAAGAQVNVATNLSLGTITATAIPLNSSTGTDVTLPAATASLAGLQSAADKTKLDGVAAGATANANTDSLAEGSTNKYFTETRVLATLMAGFTLIAGGTVSAADSLLVAVGKLQKQINDLFSGKQNTLVSGSNIKTVNGSSLLGSGDLVVSGGASLPAVQTFTGPKTLALADINTYNVSQDATAQAVTLPAQATVAWTAGAEIHFQQGAAGAVNITAAAGVSINGVTAGTFTLAGIYSAATLKRTGVDAWTLIGAPATTGASGDWCNATGTANAIVLTPASAAVRASYATGDQFRARIGTTNTGATTVNVAGLGVKTCLTVTGAALPAGYIRTDADTVMTYDGTNFVVDRLAEYGSNANGAFWRYADGRLDCHIYGLADLATSTDGTRSWISLTYTWTLPATMLSTSFIVAGQSANTSKWVVCTPATASTVTCRTMSYANTGASTVNLSASGRWY
jgi:environmental stress-induced protein Ves